MQDTCVLAWERSAELTDANHLDHWLLRVLYHRFIDGARRSSRAPVRPLNGEDDPTPALRSTAPGPEALAEHAELERRLDAAWLKLERDQRALVALRAKGYGLAESKRLPASAATRCACGCIGRGAASPGILTTKQSRCGFPAGQEAHHELP